MVGGHEDEEARAYLQARLVTHAKVLFFALIGLVMYLRTFYGLHPEIEPRHTQAILIGWEVGIVGIGLVWRAVLLRTGLSSRWLQAIDVAFAAGTGTAFGCSAYFSPELHASSYVSLTLFVFVLFTRAVIVPSSAARTAVVSIVSSLPLVIAAIGLALTTEPDVPGPAFVIGAIALTTIATALATTGSRVIVGLRAQVTKSVQLGQYTLDAKIGAGGMGVVYRAHHVLLRRPTAIKLLGADHVGAEALVRFEREVQHTSELTHPNTVAVYDYGRSADGQFYYAMEYLDGVDLEKLVKSYGPQPAGRVVAILTQVCGALQEAHDRGVIHRDIKPANIILCERGARPDVAKVVDFGLVGEIAGSTLTAPQKLLGTPAYLAPEAMVEPALVGPCTDQYALGAVGYYLLTGRRVFDGATNIDICMKHVTATPAPLTGVADALASVILRTLAKQPRDRYASVSELVNALHAANPGGWTVADAAAWWRTRTLTTEALAASHTAATMTVQLAGRA